MVRDMPALDRLAVRMLDAYDSALDDSLRHERQHGRPSTRMAFIHTFRSNLGATISEDNEDFELVEDYFQLSKIHFASRATGMEYVLKSDRYKAKQVRPDIEGVPQQLPGYETPTPKPIGLVFYRFTSSMMVLTLGPATEIAGAGATETKYRLLEKVRSIGEYPFSTAGVGSLDDARAHFAQDDADDFDDLADDDVDAGDED